MSYNDWGEVGMEKLFQCINPGRLRKLDCTSCGIVDGDAFGTVVSNFLGRNEDCCNLRELSLGDCNLTDESMKNITRYEILFVFVAYSGRLMNILKSRNAVLISYPI